MNSVGMPWYTADSWAQLRAVADDHADLVETVEEYEQKAERLIRQFAAQGIAVEKVLIDIDALVRWCRREGYRIDQKGRAAYGAMLLASKGQLA